MLQWNTIIHSKNLKTIVIPNNKDGTSIVVCILILSTFIEGVIRKRDFPVSIITNKWFPEKNIPASMMKNNKPKLLASRP